MAPVYTWARPEGLYIFENKGGSETRGRFVKKCTELVEFRLLKKKKKKDLGQHQGISQESPGKGNELTLLESYF